MATLPSKPKKLKRKSKKFASQTSKKQNENINRDQIIKNLKKGSNVSNVDFSDDDVSSIELANELEKQYETKKEKEELINQQKISDAIVDIAQSMIPFFTQLKLYQEFINQEHELDSLHFMALKRIRQYIRSIFINNHSVEFILTSLENIDALEPNDATKKIIDYLNIAQQFRKLDNNDIIEYVYLKNKLVDLPEMIQPSIIKKTLDKWNKYKHYIVNNLNLRESISYELNETYETINQNEKTLKGIADLQTNNELSKMIETISNIDKATEDNEIKTHLQKLGWALSDLESKFESYIKIRMKHNHSYAQESLKKVHQSYRNIIDLNKKIENYYDNAFMTLSSQHAHEILDDLYEKYHNIIEKNISVIEMTLQNSNAMLAFEKQIQSGIIFIASDETENDSLFYKKLNLGMLSDFTPSKIMSMTLDGLAVCSEVNDIKNALYFIYYTLSHDSQKISVTYDKKNNDFIQILSDNIKESNEINSNLEKEILSIFQKNKEERQKNHISFLEKISFSDNKKISPQAFSRYISQHIYHLRISEPNIKTMLCDEFYEWMEKAHPYYFSTENKNFGSPYYAALLFIQEAKKQNIDLSDALMIVDKKAKSLINKKHSSEEIVLQPISKFHDLLNLIEQMAEGKLDQKKENILSVKLINAIEQTYNRLFKKIQTHELAAAGNQIDEKNNKNELYSYPQSIHINKLEGLKHNITSLLSGIIINKYKNKKISIRKNTRECKKITAFYIKMMQRSFQNKQYNACSDFFYVLDQNPIKKFITNQEWLKSHEYLFIPTNNELCKLVENNHTNPAQIPLLQRFIDAQEEMSYNFIIKYITLSKNYIIFEAAKETLSHEQTASKNSVNLSDLSDTYLFNSVPNLCEVSYLTLSIVLDNEKFQEYIHHYSEEILPAFKSEEKMLVEFSTISDLYYHLITAYNREWGYHLLEKNPSTNIVSFLIRKISSTIQDHNTIPNLKEIFSILKIINEIETSSGNKPIDQKKIYKNIFDTYYDALNTTNKTIKQNTLENLEETLLQSKEFLNIIDNPPPWYKIISTETACYKSAIKIEDKLYNLIENATPEPIQEESSMASLLNSILSGGQISIFGKKDDKSSLYDFSREMSRSEYWITRGDPEDVEPSQTFRSLLQIQQSVLSKFSDESLQNQFVDTLRWSKNLSNIKSVSSIVPINNPNLLKTEIPLERETQLSVIKYLLILFDMLGKLCGKDGILTLKNYDKIDKLIGDIEKLQFSLIEEYSQRKEFNNRLIKKTKNIQEQNNQLYLYSKQNSQEFFVINEAMNNFCHLNERIAHQLLDIPFNQSVLAPNEPSPPYDQLISEATMTFEHKKNPQSPKLRLLASSKMELFDDSTTPDSSKSKRPSRK